MLGHYDAKTVVVVVVVMTDAAVTASAVTVIQPSWQT